MLNRRAVSIVLALLSVALVVAYCRGFEVARYNKDDNRIGDRFIFTHKMVYLSNLTEK